MAAEWHFERRVREAGDLTSIAGKRRTPKDPFAMNRSYIGTEYVGMIGIERIDSTRAI